MGHQNQLSVARAQEIVSSHVPERPAIIWRGQVLTHRQLTDRSRSLAGFLFRAGLGHVTPRSTIERWESGQDFVGILSRNRPEYIESMLGAFKARCVPYNLNYRYTAIETKNIMESAPTKALIYESAFADLVDETLSEFPSRPLLIEITDGQAARLTDAVRYDEAMDVVFAPVQESDPDDLFVIYTGGTTGHPKAVLWRQFDMLIAGLGAPAELGEPGQDTTEVILSCITAHPRAVLSAAPFMHGAGQWVALGCLLRGNTLIIQDTTERLDGTDIWSCVERHNVDQLFIAGNSFAVPLLESLEKGSFDLRNLKLIVSGAAALSTEAKRKFASFLPEVRIIEAVGATESGTQMTVSTRQGGPERAERTFVPGMGTFLLDEARNRRLRVDEHEVGWLAREGHVPLGYLGDRDRTELTFPVVGGSRCSIPGDRARYVDGGAIELLGRDAVTINTGGEKVFAEEVEAALLAVGMLRDAIVVGRPHPRWGQEVVAVVSWNEGFHPDVAKLTSQLRGKLASYKLPKTIVSVDTIERSPAGKVNYRWALEQVVKAGPVG
jgi:acyl-CoA synthetase (AMP-forming)/AMP-acid ligase II